MIGQMTKESQGNPCNQHDLMLMISKCFYLFYHCYYYYYILFYIHFSSETLVFRWLSRNLFSCLHVSVCIYTQLYEKMV